MRQGSMAELGDPLDDLRRPSQQIVSGLIGSPAINFVSAAVSGGDDALRVGEQNLLAP